MASVFWAVFTEADHREARGVASIDWKLEVRTGVFPWTVCLPWAYGGTGQYLSSEDNITLKGKSHE